MDGVSATSIAYLENRYRRYEADPSSVDYSWRCAFDLARALSQHPASDRPANGDGISASVVSEIIRQRGHLGARLDPLGRDARDTEALEQNLAAVSDGVHSPERLRSLYQSNVTVETAHIDDAEMRTWVRDAFEGGGNTLGRDDLLGIHEKLVQAEEFEGFIGRKYPTKKRFGAEGAESIFVLMDRLLRKASANGVDEVVVGPMHRGRTSLMGIIFGTPLPELFAKFKGAHPFPVDPLCTADVPYHLGSEAEYEIEGRKLRVTLCPNPSHLEAVDPMVLGRVRARQDLRPTYPGGVLGLLMHSDAAVTGQGIVGETLQLAAIPGFATEGTIHVIVNNQIGFTTEPWEGRTSRHCTGPFKAVDTLIIHVNADDPEACVRAADLALGFRQRFRRDAVIDLVCYRRNGHNELDEPRFTQPVAYAAIDRHPTQRDAFERKLVAEGLLSAQAATEIAERYRRELQDGFDAAARWRPNESAFPGGRWAQFRPRSGSVVEPDTGIAADRISYLLDKLATPPADIAVHPKVKRLIEQRGEAVDRGVPWSLAEALAFASLLTEGVPVRLTGQDAVRGTFSSRHFGVVDIQTGRRVSTLAQLEKDQAPFKLLNSPLSEYAVLGYEYGYSLERPDALTIWERSLATSPMALKSSSTNLS